MSTVVPWINRSEFESVYNGLFKGDISRQKRATARISTWKSRCVLPVAVESTAALFNVIIRHAESMRSGQNLEESLRHAYSLAIIRFVNHITERGQVKMKIQPVHILARQLGVPEWIVNIRHDATHGILPSMDLLKTATDFCVQWLKDEYWDKQLQGMVSQQERSVRERNNKAKNGLENLLRQFTASKKQRKMKKQQEKKLLCNIENMVVSNRKSSVVVLTELIKGEIKNNVDEDDILSIWDAVFNIFHQCGLTLPVLRGLPVTDNCHSIISTFLYHLAEWDNQEKIAEYMDHLLKCPDICNVAQLIGKMDLHYILPKHKAGLLEKLADIHTSGCPTDIPSSEVHSVHDLHGGNQVCQKSAWKLLEAADWIKAPLGVFPDCPVTYSNLRLHCNSLDPDQDDTAVCSGDEMDVQESQDDVENSESESLQWTLSQSDVNKIQNLIEIF